MKISKLFEAKEPNLSSIISPDVKKLGQLFRKNGYEIRVVGGAVRDALLGKTPKDIDLATTATPEEMEELGRENGLRVVDTGSEHGTLTFVINDEPYEITTLRIDKEADGRHAEVEWTRDFKEDARRRDLTYNAMSVDMDGKLHDYFGGHEDLKNKRTRFVGNSDERIQEDYLRILRYFRFLARQESRTSDKETLQSISNNAEGLTKISAERIWSELSKMVVQPNMEQAFKEMEKSGVLSAITMPTSGSSIQRGVKASKRPEIRPEAVVAAMLDTTPDEAMDFVTRMKMSKPEANLIRYIVARENTNGGSFLEEIFFNGIKPETIHQYGLATGDSSATQAAKIAQNAPPFPISGKDLLEKGFTPGPEMGKMINSLKKEWLDSGFKLSKEQLSGKLK